MNPKSRFVVLALAALLPGCFRTGELARLPQELEDRTPGTRLKREMSLDLGRCSLGATRLALALVPGNGDLRGTLADLHRVRVAVYRFQSPTGVDATTVQRQLESLLAAERWETVVRSREDEESAWVLCRTDQEEIREISVVSLESDELVQVRLEGNLGRFIANAVRQRDDLAPSGVVTLDPIRGTAPGSAGNEGPTFRYNRVDGPYLGWNWSPGEHLIRGLRQYGQLGYGLGAERWQYRGGIEGGYRARPRCWPAGLWPTAGAEVHDLTDTQDGWIISVEENSLTSLLFRQDYRDYYRRRGRSGYLRWRAGRTLGATISLGRDRLSPLANQVDWGLFGSGPARHKFRANPAADEVRLHTLTAEVLLNRTDRSPRDGWWASLRAERSGDWLGGEVDFRRYLAELRRYQPMGRWGRLDLRARLAVAQGAVPQEYLFGLGGCSSLRGYSYKAYPGNRMVLFNAEYWLGQRLRAGTLAPGVFLDAGTAWFSRARLAPSTGADLEPHLRASAGMSLALGPCRLHLSRPLNRTGEQGHGWQATGRLSHTF